jgi:hypothetical protein
MKFYFFTQHLLEMQPRKRLRTTFSYPKKKTFHFLIKK